MTDDQNRHGASASDELNQAHAHAEPKGDSEDGGSAPIKGHDEHLKNNRKPVTKRAETRALKTEGPPD
jgi:hypothetical protein